MSTPELLDSLPVFLAETAEALSEESDKGRSGSAREVGLPTKSPIAKEHGQQRLRLGFDVSSIVREYFTLRRCILELAERAKVSISARETEILTHCIATGIADAVQEYSKERDELLQQQAAKHIGFLAHELRNALGSARLATMSLERNNALKKVRTFQNLQRSLERLVELIDQSLVDARLRSKADLRIESLDLKVIVDELVQESTAEERKVRVEVSFKGKATMQGDRRLLYSTLSNLIHNAIKFTREGGRVMVRGREVENRLVVDIEDECGGLPEGKLEKLFDPFLQSGTDRSGFGLGLAIAKQAAEAHGGVIRVHNLPGSGCVFTLDLPREAS
jgi:signal transduction histidine kinase